MKTAYQELIESGDFKHLRLWKFEHIHCVHLFCNAHLPKGGPIVFGTAFNFRESRHYKIVFNVDYQHEDGRWSCHHVNVFPDKSAPLTRFSIQVTGRDRNGIKAQLAAMYREALEKVID